jgi:hypothetical protein
MMKADATNVLLMTKTMWRDVAPSWHPGGRAMVILSDRDGSYDLWLLEGIEPYRQRLETAVPLETFDGGWVESVAPATRR